MRGTSRGEAHRLSEEAIMVNAKPTAARKKAVATSAEVEEDKERSPE